MKTEIITGKKSKGVNNMNTETVFWREVTIDSITPEILALEKQGDFTLIWKENTIEIYYSRLKAA